PESVPRQASGPSPIAAGCTGGVASGTVYVNAEVEPWVAADPRDPNRLVAAWQQDRWSNGAARGLVTALSTDGGATWVRTLQPMSRCGGAAPGSAGDFERVSDPWVDIGPDGVVYAMGLGASGAVLAPGSASGMLVSRSTDGGRTWSTPALLIRDGADFFNDKNTLTADPTAAGFVYAV
ncbi:MAG: exo-alpha-sialidase, partial [Gemmatimonadetes bacterium]|nr:exo-alpha-sialidase [Gemmatimonadota bacterium]